MNNQRRIRVIVLIVILSAISIILRMISINVFSNNRIIFHNIPIIISSIVFGPIIGGITALVTDLSTLFYIPDFNPIFTLIALIWGVVPGLLIKIFKKRNYFVFLLIDGITYYMSSIANSLALSFLYGVDVGLGKISLKELTFSWEFLDLKWVLVALPEVIYVRILIVIIISIVKIPLDALLLNKIFKIKKFNDYFDLLKPNKEKSETLDSNQI